MSPSLPDASAGTSGTFGCGALFRIYGALWRLACPLLRRHKRLNEGFSWRLVPDDWARFDTESDAGADVWIQAASGGEAYLVREILEHLPEILRTTPLPGIGGNTGRPLRILVTTWTRQGLEVLLGMAAKLKESTPEVSVRVTFFPLDAPSIMERALTQARPRVVVLLETELWPGLLVACQRNHVPVLVLNGRMTEKSLRGYRFLDSLTAGFWKTVTPHRIAAIAPSDRERFASLFGEDRVEAVPNIKFDSAAAPFTSPAGDTSLAETDRSALYKLLPPKTHGGNTVLLASVREEEEGAVLEIIRLVRCKSNPPTILLAPRHMHRVEAWQERLRQIGIVPCLRSSLIPDGSETEPATVQEGTVILWDVFGELQQLYAVAGAVFVGGSLAPLGGQNFLEPLALGRIPCCGPHLSHFAWALSSESVAIAGTMLSGDAAVSLEKLELIQIRRNARTVAETLLRQLTHPVPVTEVQRRFREWIVPRTGGTKRCTEILVETLTSTIRSSDTPSSQEES